MYDRILVALDGSEPSRYAGQMTIAVAKAKGALVIACHVYGAEIHRRRFSDMEPGLPARYQEKDNLTELRTAHGRLMEEGFRALSAGYVEDFTNLCKGRIKIYQYNLLTGKLSAMLAQTPLVKNLENEECCQYHP